MRLAASAASSLDVTDDRWLLSVSTSCSAAIGTAYDAPDRAEPSSDPRSVSAAPSPAVGTEVSLRGV